MANDGKQILWYVRRAGQELGPYPVAAVRRYLLLGRIREDDELSLDRQRWSLARKTPEFLAALRKAASPVPEDRLLAQRRADERSGEDRRNRPTPTPPEILERRSGEERRSPEAPELVRGREVRRRLLSVGRLRKGEAVWLGALGGLVLTVIMVLGVLMGPSGQEDMARICEAAAGPGVDWSNCWHEGIDVSGADLRGSRLQGTHLGKARFQRAQLAASNLAYADLGGADLSHVELRQSSLLGANLRQANLSHANLQGADLSYSDLTGARLQGAKLAGAKLDRAIWVDGTECAQGSLGRCRFQPRR